MLVFDYPSVTADSGYKSEEGYSYLEKTISFLISSSRRMRRGKNAISRKISVNRKICVPNEPIHPGERALTTMSSKYFYFVGNQDEIGNTLALYGI